MLDTQPLITAERTELQCDVVWATSGGPSQLISEYQPVIATEGRARGGNGQMGDIRARMTLLLPCAVIVAVLLDHGRLGMAVAGRCGVRIDMAHASRGVCCAKQEDYGADAYKGAQGASAILELRRHQGQDVQGVWGDVQGGIREVRRSGAHSSQDDGRRSGARAIGQTELPDSGYSSIARGGEGRDGEQDGDSDCRGLQPPPELPLLKCPHHITLLLVYNADGYYYPPIIVLSRSKTAEKMGKKKKPQLYNLRNPVEQLQLMRRFQQVACIFFLSFSCRSTDHPVD